MRLSPLFPSQQSYPSRPSPQFGMALSQDTLDALHPVEARRLQIAAYLQRVQLPDVSRSSTLETFNRAIVRCLAEISTEVHQLGLSQDSEALEHLHKWAKDTVKTLSSSRSFSGFWAPTNIHSLMENLAHRTGEQKVPHALTQPFTDYLNGIDPE